jgi:hypothetical protein
MVDRINELPEPDELPPPNEENPALYSAESSLLMRLAVLLGRYRAA